MLARFLLQASKVEQSLLACQATPSLLGIVAKRTRRRWLESASSPAWRQVHKRVLLFFPESPVTATSRHESVFF
jgi:hypothetical protein